MNKYTFREAVRGGRRTVECTERRPIRSASAALILVVAAGCLHAATPGLPFTERATGQTFVVTVLRGGQRRCTEPASCPFT